MKLITIAIDGHSSCGKSTMAKDLAKEIGYIYIDTGAMYRSVTLFALQNGMITDAGINEEALRQRMQDVMITFRLNEETGRPDTYLNGVCVEKEIRTMEVSKYVSPASINKSTISQICGMSIEPSSSLGSRIMPNPSLGVSCPR